MRAYSIDLRSRVLEACDAGMGAAETAEAFLVSQAWVRRIKQRRRETGEVSPRRPARTGPVRSLADKGEELRTLVAAHPGLSAEAYRDKLGVRVAAVTVWRTLRRLGLTFKKSPSALRSRTAPTSPPSASGGGTR